jgi:hypothetical protein
MLFGLDIFWDNKKIDEILDSQNSVKASLLRLLRETSISVALVGLWFGYDYYSGKGFEPRHGFAFSFIIATVNAWIFSLLFSKYASGRAEGTGDARADIMEVAVRMQGAWLLFLSTIYSIFYLLGASGLIADLTTIPLQITSFILIIKGLTYASMQRFNIALGKAFVIVFGAYFTAWLVSTVFSFMLIFLFVVIGLSVYSSMIQNP